MAVRAMKLQALDFIEKPVDPDVLSGLVCHGIARDALRRADEAERSAIAARLPLLTPRERQVLDGVVRGLANKQVAIELGVSEKTVEGHRANVMRKMQAESVAELVRMVMLAAPPAPRKLAG